MSCICIVHNYTNETFAGMSYYLAHYLAKSGYNVLFISHRPHFNEPLKINDYPGFIHVYSWPTDKRPTGLKSFLWFIKIFLKYKPEIIIAHFVGSNISVSIGKLFSLGQAKTYVYYHTLSTQNLIDSKNHALKNWLLRSRKKLFYNFFVDKIICPSDLAHRDFIKIYENNRNNGKVLIVLNPLIDSFTNSKFTKRNDDLIRISFLGRLDPSKGILELLRGFLKYEEKKKTRINLHIAGSGSLADYVKDLESKSSNIFFHGHLNPDPSLEI